MSSKYALSIKTKINCLSGAACAVMLCEINFLSHRPRGPVDNKIGITQAFFFLLVKDIKSTFSFVPHLCFPASTAGEKKKMRLKKNVITILFFLSLEVIIIKIIFLSRLIAARGHKK